MSGDWLQGLTRQTQELDFSDLVQRSYRTNGDRPDEDKVDEDSVAGDVEKASVLDMIDALPGVVQFRAILGNTRSAN